MTYSLGITLLIVCPLIFLACLIDSIAGGGGILGSIAGSQIAIKKGSKFIKPVLAIVALMLLVKIVIQFVQDF